MLASVLSSSLLGVDAVAVEVEVDISQGLPMLKTVGLAEGAVREAQERVKAAIKNSGYEFPNRKITINLAPADTRKEGSAFDLPIALGILTANGAVTRRNHLGDHLVLGELPSTGASRASRARCPRRCLRARAVTRVSCCRARTPSRRRSWARA